MGIRAKAALRYASALIVIIPSLILLLINMNLAINYFTSQNTQYLITYTLLVIIYSSAIIESLLLLFPSRHVFDGILLIIESIFLLLFESIPTSHSLPNGNFFLPIISFSSLFIGGILAILYKPAVSKLTAFPKTAKRLISAGAYLTFIAILIDILTKIFGISILRNVLSLQPTNTQVFMYMLTLIITYTIISTLIFITAIFASFKLKTDNKKQIGKYSKIACLINIIAIITIVTMSSLFGNYTLSLKMSNPAQLTSTLTYNPSSTTSLSETITLISSIESFLLIIGICCIFLGALYGLAYSKNISIIKYISTNRKFLLYSITAIIIVGILLSYYSSYQLNSDNKLALASLNNKIQTYGGNLRYMLANQSAYNDALASTNTIPTNFTYMLAEGMYKSLVIMSHPQSNIYNALSFSNTTLPQSAQQFSSGENSTSLANRRSEHNNLINQENKFNWYTYNPLLRDIELSTLYSLCFYDCSSYSNLPNYNKIFLDHQQMIIPQRVSPLQSIYELSGYGLYILLLSEELGSVYHYIFLPSQSHLRNGQLNYTALPVKDLGVGLGALVPQGDLSTTTFLNGSFYDLISYSQLSNNWIVDNTDFISSKGESFPNPNNKTYMNNLLYTFALGQYLTYYTSEIFYNKTITPNIDFFDYFNNIIIINLGNLNLTDPQITLKIDSNLTNYTRHYNYLIVYNKHLSIGYHKIGVTIGNMTLASKVYISPVMLSTPYLSSIYQNNGNFNYNSSLSSLTFSIPNPYAFPLNITNFSITGGVTPEPLITPTNISEFTYNWSSSHTATPVLVNATYSKFVKYTIIHNNYDGINHTKANYTTYEIPLNTSYRINSNDFVTLDYSVPKCTPGNYRYYTVKFDTNYGKAHIILSTLCQ